MLTVNTHEAKTQLSSLLAKVSHGEEIIIVESGKPIARLVLIKQNINKRKPGIDKGKAWVADDFDAALPETLQSFFE